MLANVLGYGSSQRLKILNLIQLKPNEKLLDVGCGTGSFLVLAKQKYSDNEMVGLDIDPKILKIAESKFKKRNLNVKLFSRSAESLPFPNFAVDVVVSTLTFHHLPLELKRKTIVEIHRVLKPQGRFLLVDFGESKGGLMNVLHGVEKILGIPEAGTLKDNLDGKIPNLLRDAGFNLKEALPRYRGLQYTLSIK